MSSIAIITDTDSSLPTELAARYGIRQVPISVHFGQETLRAAVDIDDTALFARVDREGRYPTTSAPAPGEFAEAYQAAFEAGADEIVCICVSSALSAVGQAATTAAETMPDRKITIVDSQAVALVQGFMAITAAEAAQAGAPADEIVRRAVAVRDRSFIYGALATLKYLAMSGRVGHAAAGFANLFEVKPIVTLVDGKLQMLERVRSRKRALARVVELATEALAGRPLERLAVQHVACPEEAATFLKQLCAAIPCPDEVVVAEFTPGLSVHTGAGLIGVVATAAESGEAVAVSGSTFG
jgi:fatty acid kinase fatty acid binding subunit